MSFYSSKESLNMWFDELNILKSDISDRKKTSEKIEEAMYAFFLRQLEDIMMGLFLLTIHTSDYENELTDLYMTFADKDDEWTREKAKRFASEVESTTEKAVNEADTKYPKFAQARLFDEAINKSDIPKKVLDVLSAERARGIAAHESNVINNYKRHLELKKTQLTHTWDATLDEKTRPHHREADGQTVPIDEPFIVGGEKLMFPCDDSLGATAKNLLYCRCIEL